MFPKDCIHLKKYLIWRSIARVPVGFPKTKMATSKMLILPLEITQTIHPLLVSSVFMMKLYFVFRGK